MQARTNSLKKTISLFPLISVIIIGIAIINLGVYYAFFDFNIFEYVELDELIPLVLKDILIFVSFIPMFIVLLNRFSPIHIRRQINEKGRFSMRSFSLSFAMLVSLCVSTWIDYYRHKITLTGFLVISILLLTALLLRYLPQWLYKSYQKSREPLRLMLYTQLSIVVVGISIFDGLRNHLIVEDQRVRQNVTVILTDNQKIYSDKDHYYIGKTKAGIFFFNSNKHVVEIYPMATIKFIFLNKK